MPQNMRLIMPGKIASQIVEVYNNVLNRKQVFEFQLGSPMSLTTSFLLLFLHLHIKICGASFSGARISKRSFNLLIIFESCLAVVRGSKLGQLDKGVAQICQRCPSC